MTRRRDDDTVSRAKDGDPAAWRDLYQQHASRLRIWLQTQPTGDAAVDSDDIAATAWLTASRRIESFNGTTSDFAGWLFTIARNIAMTTQARSTRRATRPVDHQGHDQAMWGTIADHAAAVDGLDLVVRLIRSLPGREAEVVACIDVAGLDIATTADVLGISRAAVRVSHHRGISRVRRHLSGTGSSIESVIERGNVSARPAPGVS